MRTSILYYTNNVLSEELLKTTLSYAAEHAKNNNAELLVSSHYPLTKEYVPIKVEDPVSGSIYDRIICANWDIKCKAYVVGKKPYVVESIYEQIIHLLSNANEYIVLMEHDCMYPNDYVGAAEKALEKEEVAYVSKRHSILNHNGFWKFDTPLAVLSGYALRKETAIKIFKHKLNLTLNNIPCSFEPLLTCDYEKAVKKFPEDMLIESYVCLDDFLEEDHDLLDIKHGLNQNGYLMDTGFVSQSHPYWGNAKRFIDMIESAEISDQEINRYGYGISMF